MTQERLVELQLDVSARGARRGNMNSISVIVAQTVRGLSSIVSPERTDDGVVSAALAVREDGTLSALLSVRAGSDQDALRIASEKTTKGLAAVTHRDREDAGIIWSTIRVAYSIPGTPSMDGIGPGSRVAYKGQPDIPGTVHSIDDTGEVTVSWDDIGTASLPVPVGDLRLARKEFQPIQVEPAEAEPQPGFGFR